MTNIYLLMNLVLLSAIIVICAIPRCDGVISDKRLCFDSKCSVPVSKARTMVKYSSIEPHILSFPPNTEILIFSKEAGSRLDLWGAEVGNKRGYVPKNLVRETRKMKSNLTHEVPTEFGEQIAKPTDKPKVNVQSNLEDPKSPEGIVEAKESPAPEDIENAEDAEREPERPREPESEPVDPAPVDSQPEEAATDKAEQILEGVTPSVTVIDGTAIPYMAEEPRINPSHATPIVAATASPDKGPILSVLPNIPVTDRPLLSRFSNSDNSKPAVEDEPKTESNVAAENETRENEVQQQTDDSGAENKGGNDSKPEDSGQGNASSVATENAEEMINGVESTERNEVQNSEEPVDASGDTSGAEAAGSSATDTDTDTQKDGQNEVEDIPVEITTEDVVSTDGVLDVATEGSPSDERSENVPEIESNNNNAEQELANSDQHPPETVNNSSVIEGTISEQNLSNSGEQTEYLPEEKTIDNSTEAVDKGNENEKENENEKTVEDTENSQGVESEQDIDDNRVILGNEIPDHGDNFTVHNADNIAIETNFEDVSQQNNSQEEILGDDNKPSLENEETTELNSNILTEVLTTARSLFSLQDDSQNDDNQSSVETLDDEPNGEPVYTSETQASQEQENYVYNEADVPTETPELDSAKQLSESTSFSEYLNTHVATKEVCDINSDCADTDNGGTSPIENEQNAEEEDEGSFSAIFEQHDYLKTLLCLSITAFATLLFSLGYYYIENRKRDKELVAKINKLEKELLVTTKESMMLDEGLKATKHKLNSIEDESFGSNEMVLSLKAEIEAGQIARGELEDQIVTLEKELESATEAGLELERMLREFLASQSDENPLAQSVEDLQTRLNAQQATNESLTNSLSLKSQENEALTSELASTQQRCQQLEVEVTRLSEELKTVISSRNSVEKDGLVKITQLTKKVKKLAEERADLITQLTTKETALNDLSEILKQQNIENFDFDKLYDVSHIKAEAQLVATERDELKIKLTEVEGAHQLLEEHVKLIREEIASVTKQYELAERDKTEAQTRLEVLSNYFKEKETQLQKELGMQEAMWVQKQGEVTSTVDRIQTMQNEIQNYRQQIETLKREIIDQEREYKSQIAALETKSHEQWVVARQSERRLEESKAEASQLRNRLTMVEKNMNEADPDSKLHRLETNGETASSPQLFIGAESSSSPIIFSGSSGVPPPLPPSYMYGGPLPPPFMPPPPHPGGGPMYDISRRPPPLGGRLSSPPPIPLHHSSGRYDDASSPPPPMSPPLHPPYNHRSPPPFSNERMHPPPPFLPPPLGTSHSWGDEPLPPMRNPVFHPHQQREQRLRNHKGSLHSSGDSLDKTNHTGKS